MPHLKCAIYGAESAELANIVDVSPSFGHRGDMPTSLRRVVTGL